MKDIVKYGSKRFLSEADVYATGSVCVHSVVEQSESGNAYHSAAIVVKDCSKTVNIEMVFMDEEDFNERMGKVDILIEELVKYKGVLEEHWKVLQSLNRKVEEKENG